MKNDETCIWYASYLDKGTTFERVLSLELEERKKHPLYKCTICSPTYFSECEGYVALGNLKVYKEVD